MLQNSLPLSQSLVQPLHTLSIRRRALEKAAVVPDYQRHGVYLSRSDWTN